MPSTKRLIALVAATLLSQPAATQSLALLNAFAVDRAGTTLVDRAGARLVDARGQLRACGLTTVAEAVARRDQDGFLVRLTEGTLPPLVRVEQWSGNGISQWQVETSFFSGLAAVPGGGALISRQETGEDTIEFLRLDDKGNELWRNQTVRGERPPSFYDFLVDEQGRTLFTVPRPASERAWQVDVGMLGADGRLAWIQSELRDGFSIPSLANDGKGDFWWYLGGTATVTAGMPSKLIRMSAGGYPLYERTGPTLVAGRDIERAATGGSDTLWYLADRPDSDIDLVRLTPGGGLSRFPTGRSLITQLVADGDGTWLTAYTGHYEFTIDHYTSAGRQWSRVIRGLRDVRLQVQPGGDLRLLALESDGISLRRVSARTGRLLWRMSRPQMDQGCAALSD